MIETIYRYMGSFARENLFFGSLNRTQKKSQALWTKLCYTDNRKKLQLAYLANSYTYSYYNGFFVQKLYAIKYTFEYNKRYDRKRNCSRAQNILSKVFCESRQCFDYYIENIFKRHWTQLLRQKMKCQRARTIYNNRRKKTFCNNALKSNNAIVMLLRKTRIFLYTRFSGPSAQRLRFMLYIILNTFFFFSHSLSLILFDKLKLTFLPMTLVIWFTL